MTPTPYYYNTLYRCPKDAWDYFKRVTDFLPRRTDEPYHSGPPGVLRYRMVYDLIHPRSVVEIGFNLGHSAVMWLALGVAVVHSVEVQWSQKRQDAVTAIKTRFPGRFFIHWTHSRKLIEMGEISALGDRPALVFIDGSHEAHWVKSDILLALALETPYILLDDYDSHHGTGVVEAVESAGLIPLAIFGTMALCQDGKRFTKTADPLGGNFYE